MSGRGKGFESLFLAIFLYAGGYRVFNVDVFVYLVDLASFVYLIAKCIKNR
jgi:hypothetical protein